MMEIKANGVVTIAKKYRDNVKDLDQEVVKWILTREEARTI